MAFGSYGPGHYLYLVDDALALRPDVSSSRSTPATISPKCTNGCMAKDATRSLASPDAQALAALARADRERGPIEEAWEETRDAEKGLLGHPLLRWLRANVEEQSKLVEALRSAQWRLTGQHSALRSDATPSDWRRDRADHLDGRVGHALPVRRRQRADRVHTTRTPRASSIPTTRASPRPCA